MRNKYQQIVKCRPFLDLNSVNLGGKKNTSTRQLEIAILPGYLMILRNWFHFFGKWGYHF